jgi:hypothetical protein
MAIQPPHKRSKPNVISKHPERIVASYSQEEINSEEDEDTGSEEDEWATERTRTQSTSKYAQANDSDEGDDGVAQFGDEDDYEEEEEMDAEVCLSPFRASASHCEY